MNEDEIVYLLRTRRQDIWREEDLYNLGVTSEFLEFLLAKELVKPKYAGVYLQDDIDQIYNLMALQRSLHLDLSLVRPLFYGIGPQVMGAKLSDVDLWTYSSEALNASDEAIGDLLIASLKKVFVYLRSRSS